MNVSNKARSRAALPASLRYPSGTRFLGPEEAERRRATETSVLESLLDAGFREVILPLLDYDDSFHPASGAVPPAERYRLIDRGGQLLTVRSDFTPLLARCLAPVLEDRPLPLRLCYRGEVVRCAERRLGSLPESYQMGAELIGDSSLEADLEILTVASNVLRCCGVSPVIVCDDVTVTAATKASDRLTRIVDCSSQLGAKVIVRIGDEDAASYYTGLRFTVFAEGSAVPLVRGGRYDSLYGTFGFDTPAAGFTLSMDALEVLL